MRKATLAGWMVALSLVQARAEGPVIGLAVTDGRIELDRAGVSGNATLREGASLKTGKAAARIQLQNGARATVGIESEAKIYRDRLELARGAASAGATVAVSSMKSPICESSSSPIGVSIEMGSLAIFRILRILSSGISIFCASVAGSGSTPVSCRI